MTIRCEDDGLPAYNVPSMNATYTYTINVVPAGQKLAWLAETVTRSAGANTMEIRCTANPGTVYTVEYTDSFVPPVNWNLLQRITNVADPFITITDTQPATGKRFYRILAE